MIKRVAVVDDIASYGKCSLGVAIPVLNAAGIEVYPAITSVYSAHTPIDGYTKLDTGSLLEDTIKSWNKLNVKFDAILTGALTSKNHVYACMQLFADHPETTKIVDPVLGDFGNFYDDDFKALLPHIKKLCSHADIITPNVTEAKLLTDGNIDSITKLGAKNVIITGIVEGKKIVNKLKTWQNPKDNVTNTRSRDDKTWESIFIDEAIHGAGDLFDSVLVAKIVNGSKIEEAIDFATKITYDAVKLTVRQEGFENKGIAFEPMLKEISKL